jgi:hypothetical protein
MVSRLRELPPELRNAGIAAAALAFSLFLPWYSKSFFVQVRGEPRASDTTLTAFGVFSFVEAAVLLVAGAVLFLIWARAQGKAFHLPGGDGTAIIAAGGWALALLIWRLFDKPDVDDPGATVGIEWGIFVALLAAGALVAAGVRVRAVDRPEPPIPAAAEPPEPRERRPRMDPTAVTEVIGERPDWSGEPPEPPGRARPSQPHDEAPTEKIEDDRLF